MRKRNSPARRLVIAGVVVLFAVVGLFPIYWMLVSALLPTSETLSTEPPLLPNPVSLDFSYFSEVLTGSQLPTWFLNSTLTTVGSVFLSMLVSTFAGYSLSRMRGRLQDAASASMLLTRVLPGTLLVIPLFVVFSSLHLLNTLWSIILANCTVIIPFAVWLMKGFFDSIPKELEEAAVIDGCGVFGAFARIVLPLTRPGLAATTAYAFVLAWSDYLFAKTFLQDRDLWTLTLGSASFVGEHSVNWNSLMAVGIIAIIPVAILFLFLEPLLVKGLASGSVKG